MDMMDSWGDEYVTKIDNKRDIKIREIFEDDKI